MEIPDSLAHRVEMFKEGAHAYQDAGELFRVDSWIQVLLGQGIVPKHYHPLPRSMQEQELAQVLNGLKSSVAQSVAQAAEAPGLHQQLLPDDGLNARNSRLSACFHRPRESTAREFLV